MEWYKIKNHLMGLYLIVNDRMWFWVEISLNLLLFIVFAQRVLEFK